MAVFGIVQKLNAQINHEFYSSNLYLQLSNWCSEHSMNGAAGFLRAMAQGKVTHMMSVFDYMKQAGGMPVVEQIMVPHKRCNSLEELFHHTLEDYRLRMDSLAGLVNAAREANDDATVTFLTSLESRQRQDGLRLRTLLDAVRKAADAGLGATQTDRQLTSLMYPVH
ncbi:bacterial non-heme ferritin-like protein [Salmonella enterica subsp. enterica serovar Choleraesuis]|nr:bacterial non-heme ferritin-like protein [Salmonella enterica subsp. enterica serovar Choleraesuis]